MGEVFLYLTTTGRKTGLPRRIEIWFVEHDGRLYVVSERGREAHWVENLARDHRVRLSVGTRAEPGSVRAEIDASARIVDDEPRIAAVRALMDAKYEWSDGLVVELEPG